MPSFFTHKDSRFQRSWSTPLIPPEPPIFMHSVESCSENIDPFDIDENKSSHSPDSRSYGRPRKHLSSTSSINCSQLASQRSLSQIESSRKRSSQSSSPLPSQKRWSLSSSSISSNRWSQSTSSNRWSQSCSSVSSEQGSQPDSLHSSQSTLPLQSIRDRCSYSYPPKRRLSSPSSTLEPWKGIHERHGAGGREEPMDWSNYFHSQNVSILQLFSCSHMLHLS